jgi:hypothetical protein
VLAALTDESTDDLRVDHRAAACHPPDGFSEAVGIADPILQEVALALRTIVKQIDDIAILQELRQDEDRGRRARGHDLPGGAQAVVLEIRRHLDVDHQQIWVIGQRLAHEIPRVCGRTDDVEAGGGEDVDDALAKQRLVVADHHADRSKLTQRGLTVQA